MNVPKLSLEQWVWIIYNAGLGVEKLYELATKDGITREDVARSLGQLTTYRPDPLAGDDPPADPPVDPTDPHPPPAPPYRRPLGANPLVSNPWGFPDGCKVWEGVLNSTIDWMVPPIGEGIIWPGAKEIGTIGTN